MLLEKQKEVRNDWSDDNDSLQNEMASITSGDEKGQTALKNQNHQNSLFSSIQGGLNNHNTSVSISGGNSITLPGAESRLKQLSKATANDDGEGTMAGVSTQYPYQHDSIHSNVQDVSRGMRSGKGSPLTLRATGPIKAPSMKNAKESSANRMLDNLNKKKYTTSKDEENERIRKQNEAYSQRKNATSVEPFWQDFN